MNICKECRPHSHTIKCVKEGQFICGKNSEVEPCLRHALVDNLAAFLRRTLPVNLTAENISREEVEICELLALYDSAANPKERM